MRDGRPEPRKHSDVCDRELVPDEIRLSLEPRFQHGEDSVHLLDVASRHSRILILPGAREDEKLAEHRPEGSHLEHNHLDELSAQLGLLGEELAGLLGGGDQDCPGLSEDQTLINQHRDLVVRIQLGEFRRHLIASKEYMVDVILQSKLLEADRDLKPVWSGVCIKIEHSVFPLQDLELCSPSWLKLFRFLMLSRGAQSAGG